MADEYNFVGSGDIPDNSLPAKAGFAERMFGGFTDPNYGVNRAIRHQTVEINRINLLNAYTKRAMQAKMLEGTQRLNQYFASTIGSDTFGDEKWMQGFYTLMSQYPFTEADAKPYVDRAEAVRTRKAMLERWSAFPSTTGGNQTLSRTIKNDFTGETMTVSERPETQGEKSRALEKAYEYEAKAEQARQAGDPILYQEYMSKARDYHSIASGSQERMVGYGPEGQKMFEVTRGGSTGAGLGSQGMIEPPPGAKTPAVQFFINAKTGLRMLDKFQEVVQPYHLGMAGWAGEVVVDRGLAQLFPELAVGDRISSRVLGKSLGENLLKLLSAEGGGRMSDFDVKRIREITSTTEKWTSYPFVMEQLNEVRQIVNWYVKNTAERFNERVPDYALTPDEIKARLEKENAATDAALARGTITAEQAYAEKAARHKQAGEALQEKGLNWATPPQY